MNDFLHAVQSGSANLWLFIPAAILLGAMHGLEPGHSKTMMAAFIVAIRGTIGQAVLLGLSAAISVFSARFAIFAAGRRERHSGRVLHPVLPGNPLRAHLTRSSVPS